VSQQFPPQYPPSQQYPPQYPPPVAPPVPNNSLALVSMILGIVGVFGLPACCCGAWAAGGWCLLFGAAAAITGYLARQQVAASAGQQGGAGQAQAGLIMGIVEIALGLIFLCLFVVAMTGAITLPVLQNIIPTPSFR
jgi:hypothetical protein